MREHALVSRRIQQTPEWRVTPDLLSQPVDIDTRLAGDSYRNLPVLHSYRQHSPTSAMRWMEQLVELGLRRFLVRISAGALGDGVSLDHLLAEHEKALTDLRSRFPRGTAEIVVDPFSVALNANGTWGVLTDQSVDRTATEDLIGDISTIVRKADADAMLTLGRAQSEVAIAAAVLADSDTRIWTFSANTETSSAYAYSIKNLKDGWDTGQKILVGNTTEMLLHCLLDIANGTTMVVTKPVENLHVVAALRLMLDNPSLRREFLESPEVTNLAARREEYSSAHATVLANHTPGFGKDVLLGTYTTSGTTAMSDLVRQNRGDDLANALIAERFVNSLSAGGHRTGVIVDRDACTYLQGVQQS